MRFAPLSVLPAVSPRKREEQVISTTPESFTPPIDAFLEINLS